VRPAWQAGRMHSPAFCNDALKKGLMVTPMSDLFWRALIRNAAA